MNKCQFLDCELPIDEQWYLGWNGEIVASHTCTEHKASIITYYLTKEELIAAMVGDML